MLNKWYDKNIILNTQLTIVRYTNTTTLDVRYSPILTPPGEMEP